MNTVHGSIEYVRDGEPIGSDFTTSEEIFLRAIFEEFVAAVKIDPFARLLCNEHLHDENGNIIQLPLITRNGYQP